MPKKKVKVLKYACIEMADTAYGQFKAQQKRDSACHKKMTAKERAKLAEMDVVEANNDNTAPQNITPV